MLSQNANETLHTYLRRHYENVSKKRAQQLAEPAQSAEVETLLLKTPPAEVNS